MNGGEKLANYQPTDFRFSPDDGYLTYLHAASHQVGGWMLCCNMRFERARACMYVCMRGARSPM